MKEIKINQEIFNALNIYELSVYQALLFEKENDKKASTLKLTSDKLIELSGLKRSKLFQCLKSLEDEHFLIRRLNWDKGNFGTINEYDIGLKLNGFGEAQ